MSLVYVSDTRRIWKKMEIPVVFGEGGSHVLNLQCESAGGVSEHAISCEQVSYKITLCLHMSENVIFLA